MLEEATAREDVLDPGVSPGFVRVEVGIEDLAEGLTARVEDEDRSRRLALVDAGQEDEVVVLRVGHEELVQVRLRSVGARDNGQAALHSAHEFGSARDRGLAVPLPILERGQRCLRLSDGGLGARQSTEREDEGAGPCSEPGHRITSITGPPRRSTSTFSAARSSTSRSARDPDSAPHWASRSRLRWSAPAVGGPSVEPAP